MENFKGTVRMTLGLWLLASPFQTPKISICWEFGKPSEVTEATGPSIRRA